MRVYLAHPISSKAEFNDSKRVAERLREIGFTVYVASENNKINDKRNNPIPVDIYEGDVTEVLQSDIVVVNLTGGLQDGTISEIGVVAGANEERSDDKTIKLVGYTSNARLLNPQTSQGIPSASANHLVLGMIQKWGVFAGSEENMWDVMNVVKEME